MIGKAIALYALWQAWRDRVGETVVLAGPYIFLRRHGRIVKVSRSGGKIRTVRRPDRVMERLRARS